MMDWLGVIGISSLSSLTIVGFGIFAFRKYIGSQIEHLFGKRLEDHKHELSLITEAAKFDFQRKIHDFTLYATKKHEAYAELNNALQNAAGKISDLEDMQKEHNFTETQHALREAVSRFHGYYLYLSPSIIDIIIQLLENLQKLLEERKKFHDRVNSVLRISNDAQDKHTEIVWKLTESVENLGKKLLEEMRKELSIGYY